MGFPNKVLSSVYFYEHNIQMTTTVVLRQESQLLIFASRQQHQHHHSLSIGQGTLSMKRAALA
jgi:hypothetical protein